ncbi:hypothetical protein MBLNU457_g0505t1 [Dothideomycetes sp. NU457]
MPPAPGVTDLNDLIRSMHPSLDSKTYIYSTIPHSLNNSATLPHLPPDLEIDALIHEPEGWTLITPSSSLDSHPDFFMHYNDTADKAELKDGQMKARWAFKCRKITLQVHSSLEAVGLTAAVCRALTPVGVSCNVVAGFHHDAVFVEEGDEGTAMLALRGLVKDAGGDVEGP